MIDELARAFERSAAGALDPLDRISVRDYVREVEIGAFRSERGVSQRIRFNVVLEVSRHAASVSDDVDQVISYDMIVEAIDAILSTGRINLLETCAERVAEKCLADPRAVRVLVRVEKLDRIPGALGVEIVRNRLPGEVRKVSAVAPGVEARPDPAAAVLVIPPEAAGGSGSARWRAALAGAAGPVVAIVAPGALAEAARERAAALGLERVAARRLELLAFDQAAWAFAGAGDAPAVVETRTELQHAVKTGASVVWAPFKLANETEGAGAVLADVAAVLVEAVGAARVIAAGEVDPGEAGGVEIIRVGSPEDARRALDREEAGEAGG